MVDKKTGVKPKVKSSKPKSQPKKIKETPKKAAPAETKQEPTPEVKPTKKEVAKAGRRSAKALREEAEEAERQARKAAEDDTTEKPKLSQKPPRSRAERAGKNYREALKLIDKSKQYPMAEAIDLAVKTSSVKFDATVELHINLAVDPKQADQNVRDSVSLPAGTGKKLKIAVFADGDNLSKAKAAGADIVGENDLLAKLDKEQIGFDVLITTPNLMPRLGKYAKLLGPKGLMPNPKSGTISADIAKAVTEAKSGKVEYRVDSEGIIHLGIGKVSFGAEKLAQNADAIMNSVRSNKPASIKGNYVNSIYVTTSMGPSIKVAI